jgi:hypothetical protein
VSVRSGYQIVLLKLMCIMMNKNNINLWNLAFISFLMMPDALKAQNYVEAEDYL